MSVGKSIGLCVFRSVVRLCFLFRSRNIPIPTTTNRHRRWSNPSFQQFQTKVLKRKITFRQVTLRILKNDHHALNKKEQKKKASLFHFSPQSIMSCSPISIFGKRTGLSASTKKPRHDYWVERVAKGSPVPNDSFVKNLPPSTQTGIIAFWLFPGCRR